MRSQPKQTASKISPTNKAVLKLSQNGEILVKELSIEDTIELTNKISKLYLSKLKV